MHEGAAASEGERNSSGGRLAPGQESDLYSISSDGMMGVYVALWKTWSHSTVATALQFSKVISAILQVHVRVRSVPSAQRIFPEWD